MTAAKLKIGVLFGGRSGEHEVSLVSAMSVMNALDREKYDVVPIGITRQGRWISSRRALELLKERHEGDPGQERFLLPEPSRQGLISLDGTHEPPVGLDVVFPVVHGTYGEDGTLQGLLELAGIPYVGSGVLGSAVGMDKIVQKQLFEQAGIRVARYVCFLSDDARERSGRIVALVEKQLRYPVFTKPANTGSSVGISKAHNRRELLEGVEIAGSYDRKIIVEQGVPQAREIECAVLGNDAPEASVPGEIVPSNEFYDYDAKYVDGKSRDVIPAKLPVRVAAAIRKTAVQAFRVLDCAGMARVDFFVSGKKHRIVLNEVNTIPGFTSISMYPKLWEASGLDYPRLLDRLIALARERHAKKTRLTTSYRPNAEWYKS
jgi:D-alanine-D-alanine ligase